MFTKFIYWIFPKVSQGIKFGFFDDYDKLLSIVWSAHLHGDDGPAHVTFGESVPWKNTFK